MNNTDNNNEHRTIKADLILLHAPSVFDFRDKDDVLFAYLSDSDSVNVTSVYEQYPLGFFSIKQRLNEHGLKAEIINIASLMLMHPGIDVDKLISNLEAPLFGIDLHWMAHCQGSIELAKRVKAVHKDCLVIFGGISSTYYAEQLIRYPAVDVVVRGYDTLEPVTQLVKSVKDNNREFHRIPNLIYRLGKEEPISTGFTYKPADNYNDSTVDWSYYKNIQSDMLASKLIMTLPNTGCAHDCPWCGGSRHSYKKIMGVRKTLIAKDNQRIVDELKSLAEAAKHTSIYALQCYSEPKGRMHEYLDAVKGLGFKRVYFEQFHLTPQVTLEKMGKSTMASIMLSPESHDQVISKLAGRGNYSMKEMEEWIPRALDAGIEKIVVWFFIGMPRQTPQSVLDTVSYSESLMKKFRDKNVIPLICPMVPFLDPGSRFFEEPDKHGYRIFHKTLEEHRQAVIEPVWDKRLNYETEWMSRRELRDITYEAITRMLCIKGELSMLPPAVCQWALNIIEETSGILKQIDRAMELDGSLSADLRAVIARYNQQILQYSNDQIVPIPRPFGGRWFDDFTVPDDLIKACQ